MLNCGTRAGSRLTFVLLAVCVGFVTRAAATLPQPGEVDAAWFADNPYAADSSVHAYVIAQETQVLVMPDLSSGGELTTAKHVRRIVRVLDAQGYRHATVRLLLRGPGFGAGSVELDGLEAHTHHGDGRRVTLSEGDVFSRRLSAQVVEVSFSFPGVTAGCVLDLAYRTTAEQTAHIEPAVLQADIPMLRVAHELATLDALVIQPAVHGYFPIATQRFERDHHIRDLPGRISVTRLTAADVPALASEPHVTSMRNYAAHVTYDLEALVIPGVVGLTFSGTWEEVAKRLREDADLGAAMRGRGRYKKWASEAPASLTDVTSRVRWAVGQVADAIAWNGYDAPVASGGLNAVLRAGEGSSADLNVALIGLCNGMGLEAVPMYLSTRPHGRFQRHIAASGSLNHVIVAVRAGRGEDFRYIDATVPEAFPGALPERDLNGEGLLVFARAHAFVDLQANAVSQRGITGALALGDDGYLSGELDLTLNTQAALPYLRRGVGGEIVFAAEALDLLEDFDVGESSASPEADGERWVVRANVRSAAPLADIGGARALAPTIGRFREGSPFALPERSYPIEFPTRTVETRSIRIALPENVQVGALPKPISAALADGSGRFRHEVELEEGGLRVSSLFHVKDLVYLPQAYPELRGLYELAAKRSRQLISLSP